METVKSIERKIKDLRREIAVIDARQEAMDRPHWTAEKIVQLDYEVAELKSNIADLTAAMNDAWAMILAPELAPSILKIAPELTRVAERMAAIAERMAAPKRLKVIRDSKGDITETVEVSNEQR